MEPGLPGGGPGSGRSCRRPRLRVPQPSRSRAGPSGECRPGPEARGYRKPPPPWSPAQPTLSHVCCGLPPLLSVLQARGTVLCGWGALARGLVLPGLREDSDPGGLGPVEAA